MCTVLLVRAELHARLLADVRHLLCASKSSHATPGLCSAPLVPSSCVCVVCLCSQGLVLAAAVAQVLVRWCCRRCICFKVCLYEVICGAKRNCHLCVEGLRYAAVVVRGTASCKPWWMNAAHCYAKPLQLCGCSSMCASIQAWRSHDYVLEHRCSEHFAARSIAVAFDDMLS